MNPIPKLLYLITPLVLAGISNMLLVKLPILDSLKVPIDRGKILADGRRLLGDNKTWKGFWGMVMVTSVWMAIFEWLAKNWEWARQISLIPFAQFRFPFNGWFYGALWGLAYVLAELPNSYIKRRLDIQPGQKGRGLAGMFFAFFNQADSVIGCLLIMPVFYKPSLIEGLAILLLATGTHLVINLLLYGVKLKSDVG